MGGETFYVTAEGPTPQAAFEAAVRRAQYDHGHGGYTGTIAEKGEFVMIEMPEGPARSEREATAYAKEMIGNGDPRVDDKWGPAGCIALPDGKFLFFGCASS